MFNIGPAELLVIGVVLLIAVGPEQLPGVIRRVGQTVAQVRSMTEGLRSEFMAGLDEIERAADPKGWAASDQNFSASPTNRAARTTPPAETDETPAESDEPAESFDEPEVGRNPGSSTEPEPEPEAGSEEAAEADLGLDPDATASPETERALPPTDDLDAPTADEEVS